MNLPLQCACLCVLLYGVHGAVVISDLEVEKSWNLFKKENDRRYLTLDEEMYRKRIFEENLQLFVEHNMAYERGEYTYTLGITPNADRLYDDVIKCKTDTSTLTSSNATEHVRELLQQFGKPPASKDWRDDGIISNKVENQDRLGACGSCYAFASTQCVESKWTKAMRDNKKKVDIPDLSEQQAIDCSRGKKYKCNGCAGGYGKGVLEMVRDIGGMMYEKDYPYKKNDKVYACAFDAKKAVVKITNLKFFKNPTNPDENMEIIVGTTGPIVAPICYNSKFMHLKGKDGKNVFSDPGCFQECKTKKGTDANHELVVVGYTKQYFILKNSWGDKWGDNGYLKIARPAKTTGEPTCGLGVPDQTYPYL